MGERMLVVVGFEVSPDVGLKAVSFAWRVGRWREGSEEGVVEGVHKRTGSPASGVAVTVLGVGVGLEDSGAVFEAGDLELAELFFPDGARFVGSADEGGLGDEGDRRE